NKGFVDAVAFSPEGRIVASGSRDRISLCDPATGNELGLLEAKGMEWINGLAFTPDGKTLVSGSQDGNIRVWDVAKGQARFTLNSGMLGRSMALSQDGSTVAIGTASSAIRLWNVATGRELCTEFQGHRSWVNCVAFTPDGKTLVSGEFYDQIRL